MNKVNGFGAYQNNYYDNAVKNRKQQSKTEKTGQSRTGSTRKADSSSVQLSDRAKALLQELKRTYSNMDFMVADYESEEEAAAYLARGTKDYSVLIDPEELERMASDDSVKEQNLTLLDDAVGKLDEMSEQLGDQKDEVVRLGINIGRNGEVSYFAELEKAGERQKEFVDRIRENKKEAARLIPKHTANMTMSTVNAPPCMHPPPTNCSIRSKISTGMLSRRKPLFPHRAAALISQSNHWRLP